MFYRVFSIYVRGGTQNTLTPRRTPYRSSDLVILVVIEELQLSGQQSVATLCEHVPGFGTGPTMDRWQLYACFRIFFQWLYTDYEMARLIFFIYDCVENGYRLKLLFFTLKFRSASDEIIVVSVPV